VSGGVCWQGALTPCDGDDGDGCLAGRPHHISTT
jgi:hypothetical protein